MRIRNIVLCAVCALLSIATAQAQSAYWTIKPNYQSITRFSPSLFKVKTYSSMGIWDGEGKTIVPVSVDSITYLTNGYALALTLSDGKYRVTSIIRQDGSRADVKDELYAGDYPFFSEDKCPVYNKKGKYGYMDPTGKVVIQCNYAAVHPFHEGLASVSKTKGGLAGAVSGLANTAISAVSKNADTKVAVGAAQYIDAKGVAIKLQKEIGDVELATSFKNGQAMVQNKNEKTFIIDKSGKIIRSANNVNFEFDDYFALVEDGNGEKANVPYNVNADHAYQKFMENGYYGFKTNGNNFIPAQFEYASDIADGYAVVKTDRSFGVIRISNTTINCNVSEYDDKLTVTATLPAEWDNKTVNVNRIVDGSTRTSFAMSGNSGTRSLEVDITDNGGKKSYELECEKLIIWRSQEKAIAEDNSSYDDDSKKAVGKGGIAVSAPGPVKANAKGICAVTIRVTNRSTSAQTVSLTLSTGQKSSVKVAAGKSGSVTVNVPVLKETKCTITARCGAGSSSCTTTLKPYFVL